MLSTFVVYSELAFYHYDNVGTAITQLHLSYTPCLQLLNGLDHFDDEVYVNYHLFIDLAFFGNRHELNRIALA